MTYNRIFLPAGLAIVLLAGSGLAMAQVDLHAPGQAFSGLLELIRNNAMKWSAPLQAFALQLFWLLVVIDVVLIFGQLVMRNADTGELLGEFIKFVMTIGFFASILIYSVTWSEAIINSFRQAGSTAAGVGLQLTPGDMFSLGVELAYMVSDVGSGFNPGSMLLVAGSALIILICFVFIAGFMMLTLVQSYVIVYASVLFMGFGGSKYTREYAISPIRYAVAVGAKLFALTLIVGIVMTSARELQAAYHHDNTSMFTMAGLAAVCALLSKTVPEFLEGMITGTSSSGGGALGGMAAAGMAFAAGAMAGLHTAAQSSGILGGAGKSVSDLLKSSGGGTGGPGGSSGSSMNMMGGAPGGGGSGSASPRTGGSRVGGGSTNYAPPPPPSPSASATNSSSGTGSGGSSAASSGSSGSTSGGGSGGSAGASTDSVPKAFTAAAAAHAAAEMGIKTFGTAASIAVPGMEGSESLSIGPPPSPPEVPDLGSASGSIDTPENVIRPASDAHAGIDPVAETTQTAVKPIETMADLQNALNNKGKLI
jgi:type IV secretion system protein TrbL